VVSWQNDPFPNKGLYGDLEAAKGLIRNGDVIEAITRNKHSVHALFLSKERNPPQRVDPRGAQCASNLRRKLSEGLSDLKVRRMEEAYWS
jgi:hypothetical protein